MVSPAHSFSFPKLRGKLKTVAGLDTYEAALVSIAGGDVLRPEQMLAWKRKVAPGNVLKLLAMALLNNAGSVAEIRRQLLFLLQGLDHKSRAFLELPWVFRFAKAGVQVHPKATFAAEGS